MTSTVDDVLRDYDGKSTIPSYVVVETLRAEILALRAEMDALRVAMLDMPNPVSVSQKFWEKRHAAVIARAREAGE